MTVATNIVEAIVCARAVSDLLAAGYEIKVDNGDDVTERLSERDAVLREMFACDDDLLRIYRKKKSIGWVRLIYGNGGFDVISDYTTNLESVLKPANDLADRMEEKPTEWLLDMLGIGDALKIARDCITYCRRAHPDPQRGDGIPVETVIDAAIAKANGGAA